MTKRSRNRSALFGIQRGLAYVPEDRTHVGTAPNLSVTDNVIMKNYRQPPIAQAGMLDMPDRHRVCERAERGLRYYRSQCGDTRAPAFGWEPAACDPGT